MRRIEATHAANDKIAGATQHDRDEALSDLKKQDPSKQYDSADIEKQVYQNFYNQALTESQFGTGGKVQQAIQAATAAVQGLAGGNIAQAMAGGAAPYLAEVIHKMTEDKTVPGGINVEANLMAHAVLGAVVAQTSGHSAPLLNHFQTDGLASPVYSVDQLLYQYEETGCPPLWYLRHAYATAQRFHPGG